MIQLLGMVSGDVKAVTLLFPCSGAIAAKRKEEDEKIATQGQPPIDPTIFWMKQTVCSIHRVSFVLVLLTRARS
jgi:ubiquitin carboxyl-terminal hydrolase L3